jgi:L-fucose mutarotase
VLKRIDPLLTPDLLHVLAAMGHGDELAVVDRNFPSVSVARRLVRLDGVGLTDAVRAVLTLLPLDEFVDAPVAGMAVVGAPDEIPEAQQEVMAVADEAHGAPVAWARLDRHAFYERSRGAFAVLATGEARPYGCVLLTKGVIF